MPRFLTAADYQNIKPEILAVVTGSADPASPSANQLAAENTAIATIVKYIGGRYDTNAIFGAAGDQRDSFIIFCVVVITLYNLYHKTGMKDIPEHRVNDYHDVKDWLTQVGAGEIPTNLPALLDQDNNFTGEVRINSTPPCNQRW